MTQCTQLAHFAINFYFALTKKPIDYKMEQYIYYTYYIANKKLIFCSLLLVCSFSYRLIKPINKIYTMIDIQCVTHFIHEYYIIF